MAIIVHRYNLTPRRFLDKSLDFTKFKIMLINTTAVSAFDATHTSVDSAVSPVVSTQRANEVKGNGWTQGGELITTVAAVQRSTTGAALTADNVRKTATGGNIGPARGYVMLESTLLVPLYLVDFGQDQTAGQDTDFLVSFDPNGTPGTVFTIS